MATSVCPGLTQFFRDLSLSVTNACNDGKCCTSACCGGQVQVIVGDRKAIPQHLQPQVDEAAHAPDLQTAVDRVPRELHGQLKRTTTSAERAGNQDVVQGILAFATKALAKIKEGIDQQDEGLKKREAWLRFDVAMSIARVNLQKKIHAKENFVPVEAERLVDIIRTIRHRGSQSAKVWNVLKAKSPKTLAELNALKKSKEIEGAVLKSLLSGATIKTEADLLTFIGRVTAAKGFGYLSTLDMQLFFKAVPDSNGFVSWLSAEEILDTGLGKSPPAAHTEFGAADAQPGSSGSSDTTTPPILSPTAQGGEDRGVGVGAGISPATPVGSLGASMPPKASSTSHAWEEMGAGVASPVTPRAVTSSEASDNLGSLVAAAHPASSDPNKAVDGNENDQDLDGIELNHRGEEGAAPETGVEN